MTDKPDVAALTDEQCLQFRMNVPQEMGIDGLIRTVYAAGRASLQANVPADVAALIARLKERVQYFRNRAVIFPDDWSLRAEYTSMANAAADAAAALQSQQERIAEAEDHALRMARGAMKAEARVAELEKKYAPGMDPKDDPL